MYRNGNQEHWMVVRVLFPCKNPSYPHYDRSAFRDLRRARFVDQGMENARFLKLCCSIQCHTVGGPLELNHPPFGQKSPLKNRMRRRAFPLRTTTHDYACLRISTHCAHRRHGAHEAESHKGHQADSGIAHPGQHTSCVSSHLSCPKAQVSRTCGR